MTNLPRLILFTLIIGAIDLCWNAFVPERAIPHVWFILVFFALATYSFHVMAIKSAGGKPQAFVRFYMAGTMVRFLIYVGIIAAYRFFDKSTVIPFAIGFLVHYFAFTIFEVSALLKQLRNS